MGRQFSSLEKEALINQYMSGAKITMKSFSEAHGISTISLRKWLREYEEGGIEALEHKFSKERKDYAEEGEKLRVI